ncbi:MAG: hypothetical protein JXA68_11320 [Ignavibacteriales bacterium]|nr:hypothetical protein [Ignavibacteriales bacterium]
MKALLKVVFAVALLNLCGFVYADDPLNTNGDYSKFTEEQICQFEENLLAGLQSDNSGLKISCAYFFGEIKSEEVLIPLMAMLREGANDQEKIIADLSLYKIGNARGVYLVKGASKFADSERVRKMCDTFYTTYVWEQKHPQTEDLYTIDIEYNGTICQIS